MPWISSIVASTGSGGGSSSQHAGHRGLVAGGEVGAVVVAVDALVGAPGGSSWRRSCGVGAVSKVLLVPKPTRSTTFALFSTEPVRQGLGRSGPLASHAVPLPAAMLMSVKVASGVGSGAPVGGTRRRRSGSGSARPSRNLAGQERLPVGRTRTGRSRTGTAATCPRAGSAAGGVVELDEVGVEVGAGVAAAAVHLGDDEAGARGVGGRGGEKQGTEHEPQAGGQGDGVDETQASRSAPEREGWRTGEGRAAHSVSPRGTRREDFREQVEPSGR